MSDVSSGSDVPSSRFTPNGTRYPEYDAEIIRVFRETNSMRETARRTHWSFNHVRARLIAHNIPRPKQGGQPGIPNDARSARIYKRIRYLRTEYGMTPKEIGRAIGMSPESVRWRLSRLGLSVDAKKKIRCQYGHEFTPGNTIIMDNGRRACLTCRRRSKRDYARRKQAEKKQQQEAAC